MTFVLIRFLSVTDHLSVITPEVLFYKAGIIPLAPKENKKPMSINWSDRKSVV